MAKKIAGTAKLKQIIIKPDCVDLRFDSLSLSPDQIGELSRWEKGKEELKITMELTQGRLPGT